MDLHRILLVGFCFWQLFVVPMVFGNNVYFEVKHKFKGKRNLKELRAHDARRHGRMLGSIDMPLGGNGQPSDAGLFFTKIQIGNPSKDFHVQVDTGSDILWVNCADCDQCPKKSGLGIKLNFFDPQSSSTSKLINCGDEQCLMIYQEPLAGCKSNMSCDYDVTYGDGSTTSGRFIEDTFHFDSVSGNQQTTAANASITFGCGNKQSGQLTTSDEALDGIIGFGQANSSVLSQLAAAGKVKKMFAHCLDNTNGGGIFAIGNIVEPKMKSAPLIPNQLHYNLAMKSIEVAGDVLRITTDTSSAVTDASGGDRGAIIDSGTTLTYLPDDICEAIVKKVLAQQPNLQIHVVEDQYKCLQYSGNIDDAFPNVVFNFENSLQLTVYPHEYFFPLGDGDHKWCVGWMNSGIQSRDGKDVTILGDLVLSGKLVFYDLENQTIGWTEYNCSSSIRMKDEQTGAVYTGATKTNELTRGFSNRQTTMWSLVYFCALLSFAQLF